MKRTRLFRVGFIVAAVLGMLVTQCGGSDSPEGQTDLQDEVVDPCDQDPCQVILDAAAGSCEDHGGGDFT